MYVAVLLWGVVDVLYVVYFFGGIRSFGCSVACLQFVEVVLEECRFWDGGMCKFSFEGPFRPALSNAAPAGALAPAIYFSGALRKHII
jgi:hypothetical protein